MNPKLRAALPMLLDLVIPIAGYYLLSAVGLDDFRALTISGAVTAVWAIVNTVRRGRLDTLGTLVVLEIALSVALFLVTRDPRIVLLKPSFYTALAGLYLLWTCAVGRPFTIESTRPMATRGDPERTRAVDAATAHSAGFRREHVIITAGWAGLWLAESVVRAVVVLNTSVADGVWAGQIPGVAAIALGVVLTRLRVPRLRHYVESALPTPAAPPSPSRSYPANGTLGR